MGVPTSEVGYTSAMPRKEDHEVRQGHVGELGGGDICNVVMIMTQIKTKTSALILQLPIIPKKLHIFNTNPDHQNTFQ